ncbi:MAG: bifunctional 2-C-methyl-D-erythritol 4-phosphate cytidylyltransferase/2-C-methyl-D-erythritol 2,4-cyclodiphosphate synthase [Alphaproteobacteria bacterium]
MKKRDKTPEFHVLIAAAGSGERLPSDLPKQYMVLIGKPLLRHTIEAFLALEELESLRVIIHPDHIDLYKDAVHGLNLAPPLMGAGDRKLSVYSSLSQISNIADESIILIHDAVRPLVERTDIYKLLEAMQTHEAASLAVPVSDTLRKGHEVVDRTGLWAVQTPQAFRFGVLKRAHAAADKNTAYTDDTGLVSALGIPVKLVEGSRRNIKVTYADDLEMAERLMSTTMETRTGMGFDVHAFERDDENRKLMLCGVEVAHDRGLAGHSDADVGLHAITDALLGAVGAGDIGQHFPPSDSAYKNMDSVVFLQKALEIVRSKGGKIRNIDVTLICEAPRIAPYREKMQERIAEILILDSERVNVKATTTEKLGFTGRGEGISAQAVATVGMRS